MLDKVVLVAAVVGIVSSLVMTCLIVTEGTAKIRNFVGTIMLASVSIMAGAMLTSFFRANW